MEGVQPALVVVAVDELHVAGACPPALLRDGAHQRRVLGLPHHEQGLARLQVGSHTNGELCVPARELVDHGLRLSDRPRARQLRATCRTVARMRISAKVDYAIRAMVELAAAPPGTVKVERIATEQGIPRKFLENILLDLRHAELVASRRGVEGGYRLARPAEEISVADVIRAVEGPLASVRGARPDELEYLGPATSLRDTWIELRAAIRGVLEETTLADLVARSAGD